MTGSYEIVVSNVKVRYEFTIRRNITVVKGDSATGKTTLVEMIREHYEAGVSSGIDLKCEKTCRVLAGRDWNVLLGAMHDSIIFIDEDNEFLPTDDFARAVRESDNYYVIVSREGLANLPYSVEEIYGIRESGKYASMKRVYNEFYHIYGNTEIRKTICPERVIVEDSNSGYEFFKGISEKKDYTVTSANGKSNIFAQVMNCLDRNVLVIADGAAFGAEMDRMMKLALRKKGVALYLPESFEWLLLKSGVVTDRSLDSVLASLENWIESRVYFSWERFFTALLSKVTKDTYLRYSKRKLNEVYLHENIVSKIVRQITGIEL